MQIVTLRQEKDSGLVLVGVREDGVIAYDGVEREREEMF